MGSDGLGREARTVPGLGEGRCEDHVRQADRPLSFRHEARGRSAGAPGGPRYEYLRDAVCEGVREPVPVLLPSECLRNTGDFGDDEREAAASESVELRAL